MKCAFKSPNRMGILMTKQATTGRPMANSTKKKMLLVGRVKSGLSILAQGHKRHCEGGFVEAVMKIAISGIFV